MTYNAAVRKRDWTGWIVFAIYVVLLVAAVMLGDCGERVPQSPWG